VTDLTFPQALTALIDRGVRIRRESWPEGRFLIFVPGSEIRVSEGRPLGDAAPELLGTLVRYGPHIDVFRDGNRMGAWFADSEDMLAYDWTVTT